MIVPMTKVYIATGGSRRDALLEALRDLGVVHLMPVDPAEAVPDDQTARVLDTMGRAEQILAAVTPAEVAAGITPVAGAEEALLIQRRSIERQSRLTTLYRQMSQLDIWGDLKLDELDALAEAGVQTKFAAVPAGDAGAVKADLVRTLRPLPGKKVLVALAWRGNEDEHVELPESAEPIARPQRDQPSIRAEAAEIDADLKADQQRLAELAHLLPDIRREHTKLQARADFTVARKGGLHTDALFAVQGWVPKRHVETLASDLADRGMPAAVETLEPAEDEQPPTLVEYPRWARPIQALFQLLGTTPGYREFDLSAFFMVALPVFAAMLIGDAGYGLAFTLVALIFFGRIRRKVSPPAAQLVLIFGLVTFAWGALSGNYFGVSPHVMIQTGGIWAKLGQVLQPVALLWRDNDEAGRNLIIQISFIFGTTHLTLAHLLQASGYFPHPKFLSEIGWSCFLVGMLGVIWGMFFPDQVWMPPLVMLGLLATGGVLVLFFSHPSRNLLKRLGLGLAGSLMPMISTFSDTISYIRLMAVGLASYYIAVAFNGLAVMIASGGAYLIPAAVLVDVFAHLLNIALGLIAIFAHAVRLNMLEFSSNAGVQWSGYPYAPFARTLSEGE